MTNQPEECKGKYTDRKNKRKATWRSNILKSKYKVVIWWYCFLPARSEKLLREQMLWLIDVGHSSWWYMRRVQHATHNPKFEKDGFIQIFPFVVLGNIKRPTNMFKDGHHLRNKSQPPPTYTLGEVYNIWSLNAGYLYVASLFEVGLATSHDASPRNLTGNTNAVMKFQSDQKAKAPNLLPYYVRRSHEMVIGYWKGFGCCRNGFVGLQHILLL